jgi:prepilin-type N-terminal cleavage/methylation domain-containing protein
MRSRPRTRRDESGFTMIEVMVVIGIIAILAGAAIPGFSAWIPDYRLKSAVQDLYSNMQLAKMEAIRSNSQYRISFDTTNKTYQVIRPDGSTEKEVNLSDYGSGVTYGGGGVEYDDDDIGFTSRGMTDEDEKWVYLTNAKNTSYRVGTLRSGVIRLERL